MRPEERAALTLERALEIFGRDDVIWVQGDEVVDLGGGDTGYCALGAIGTAADELIAVGWGNSVFTADDFIFPATRELVRYLRSADADFNARHSEVPSYDIADWNDDEGREPEEVTGAFWEAAAELRAQGQPPLQRRESTHGHDGDSRPEEGRSEDLVGSGQAR